jgi:hypothetical protein
MMSQLTFFLHIPFITLQNSRSAWAAIFIKRFRNFLQIIYLGGLV